MCIKVDNRNRANVDSHQAHDVIYRNSQWVLQNSFYRRYADDCRIHEVQ